MQNALGLIVANVQTLGSSIDFKPLTHVNRECRNSRIPTQILRAARDWLHQERVSAKGTDRYEPRKC